jgi:protein involved in polysaccharide export with SLBB domain
VRRTSVAAGGAYGLAPAVVAAALCGVLSAPGAAQPQPQPRVATPPASGAPAQPEQELPANLPTQPERVRFTSPEALEAAIDPATYVLGPQDLLAVMIRAGEVRVEHLAVLPDGAVLLPNVGSLPAAGRTLEQFGDDLHRLLSRSYRNFELECHLALPRQIRVFVTGEVREPGTIVARAYERVSDAIERAGGFTETASHRTIELRGVADAPVVVDLDAYYLRGELPANPPLGATQVVFVPARRRQAEILGEVARPGTYEPKQAESLRELLDLAGGPTPRADLSQVSVDTIDSTGTLQVHLYDLHHDSPPAGNVVRVSVLSSLLGKRRAFAILPDGKRLALYLSPSETLHDLVHRVGQLQPEADLQEARLVTRDSTGNVQEHTVDVARVLAGEEDRPLQDGDVLSLPAVKDYVYVSGYVARPGRYPYRADWTVGDYLGEAGGTAGAGNRDRSTILGANGGEHGADRSGRVERGDTIHINRSTSSTLAAALSIVTNVSALVISVVALTK